MHFLCCLLSSVLFNTAYGALLLSTIDSLDRLRIFLTEKQLSQGEMERPGLDVSILLYYALKHIITASFPCTIVNDAGDIATNSRYAVYCRPCSRTALRG